MSTLILSIYRSIYQYYGVGEYISGSTPIKYNGDSTNATTPFPKTMEDFDLQGQPQFYCIAIIFL